MRLLDLICWEGSLLPIFRFALAYLQLQEKALLQLSDIGELNTRLRDAKHVAATIGDVALFFEKQVATQKPRLPAGFGDEGRAELPGTPKLRS